MADDQEKPKDPASDAAGAGTKPHKPSKADLAKLPGGADFDVAGASSEDFDKHFEILSRQAKLDSLKQPVYATLEAQVAPATSAVPAEPNPDDIRAVKNGEVRYFTPTTWALMGDSRFGWEPSIATPSDL